MSRVLRYVPHRPLPPYSYVPGMFPHPISDVDGHMHGQQEASPEETNEAWHECEAWRFGFDLFNHGFYWEAHEAWEHAWIVAGRRGRAADLIKGLIKLAAAGVKAREGKPEGVRRHARRAEELFTAWAENDADRISDLLRLNCTRWAALAHRVNREADKLLDPRVEPAVIVFDFTLEPPAPQDRQS